jgi:hypothetical protein
LDGAKRATSKVAGKFSKPWKKRECVFQGLKKLAKGTDDEEQPGLVAP